MTSELPLPPGPHPTPDELRRARRGPRDERAERVLEHAALCSRCAEEEYRIDAFDHPDVSAREVNAAWRRFTGQAPRQFAAWRPLALAATLFLAVGIVVVLRNRPAEDAVRGGSGVPALQSPAGLLAAPPAEFVFAVRDATPLRVRVFDAAHAYEWTSEPTTDGRAAFPPEEQRKLRPGVEYFWTLLGADVPARRFRVRG